MSDKKIVVSVLKTKAPNLRLRNMLEMPELTLGITIGGSYEPALKKVMVQTCVANKFLNSPKEALTNLSFIHHRALDMTQILCSNYSSTNLNES